MNSALVSIKQDQWGQTLIALRLSKPRKCGQSFLADVMFNPFSILFGTGARTCRNGFTVVYRIDLAKVEVLDITLEPEIETGSTVAPVQSGPGTGATVAGVSGPPRPPNHPKTIHKPPTRRREAVQDEEAEKILAAYPPDRLRGKAACLARIEEAMKDGTTPEDLLQSVQSYATDSAGLTRSRVCFSDNWFQSRR